MVQSGMDESNGEPEGVDSDGLSGFLEPHSIRGGIGHDLALLERAIREHWPIPADVRVKIIKRMVRVIERETVGIPTPTGVYESEAQADRNAIGAAAQIRGMTQDDREQAAGGAKFLQAERFKAAELAAPKGPDVNVAVIIQVVDVPVQALPDVRRPVIVRDANHTTEVLEVHQGGATE